MSTTTYHVSNLGAYAGDVRPDLDGYVHMTGEAVLAGRWDALAEIDEDAAQEIAEHNRTATERAEAALAEWQQSQEE